MPPPVNVDDRTPPPPELPAGHRRGACDRVLALLPVACRVLGWISDEHRAGVGCAGQYKVSDLTSLTGASRSIYSCYGLPAQALSGFETESEIRRLAAEAVLMAARSRANDRLLDLWFPKAYGARAPAPPGELLLEACDWAAVAVTSTGSKGAGRLACLSAMKERVEITRLTRVCENRSSNDCEPRSAF